MPSTDRSSTCSGSRAACQLNGLAPGDDEMGTEKEALGRIMIELPEP